MTILLIVLVLHTVNEILFVQEIRKEQKLKAAAAPQKKKIFYMPKNTCS